jgi:Secretion system C-terminal sorting domain
MKQNVFLLLVSVAVAIQTHAQNICFTYDAAGNRTTRVLCNVPPQALISSQQTVSPQVVLLEPGQVLLYPNPNHGVFQLRSNDYPPETEVIIFDANARVVQVRKLGDGVFDLSVQPPGIYILQLSHTGIRPKTVKIDIVKD